VEKGHTFLLPSFIGSCAIRRRVKGVVSTKQKKSILTEGKFKLKITYPQHSSKVVKHTMRKEFILKQKSKGIFY